MLFLINDTVFDVDARELVPPLDAQRFSAVSLGYVIQLGKELYAEEPLLHRVAPERARRLAALLSMKQPDINAALFVAPARGCAADQVTARFCNLAIEVMAQLHTQSQRGALDALAADREVWRRLAA
ncbi:MAG TPA: hypothetical protein VG407_13340 [Caulobacteraceae bacterium]|nr:hypothetical protein [Caulobacteraceae bacterium]